MGQHEALGDVSSTYRQRQIAVRLGHDVILCLIDEDGVAVVPPGAGIDVELTSLFEDILAGLGHNDDEIQQALDRLRVQYVMGRQPAPSWLQLPG